MAKGASRKSQQQDRNSRQQEQQDSAQERRTERHARSQAARAERERELRELSERQARERRRRVVIGIALLGLALLLGLGMFIGPDVPAPGEASISLVAALAIGLTAGGLSCLAVQGGLLTVAVTGERARDPQVPTAALAGDARPILWFLSSKLIAYTALGALLGALGQLAQPSIGLRVAIQAATALLMIATAMHFLGVHPIFRYAIIQPPRTLTRRISATARGGGAFAPALLGALTIFLPCGVTQAMQLIAINSGDPVTGAATMAAFVLGTSPLFFSLGYFATKFSEAAHARFLKVAAVAILAVSLFTLDAALRLGGSPVTFASAKEALFAAPKPVAATIAASGTQEALITAGAGGYSPQRIQLQAGSPARLRFTGDGSSGCALALIFEDRQYILSPDAETPIELPAMKAGQRIDYTCSMGMFGGRIEVV